MICPKCGANMEDDSIFCTECEELLLTIDDLDNTETADAPLPAEEAKQPRRNKPNPARHNYRMLKGILAAGLILLVTICAVIGFAITSNGYITQENAYGTYVSDGKAVVIYNDKLIQTNVSATGIRSDETSLDGSIYAFLTNQGTLCVVRGRRVIVVADKVSQYSLSAGGNGIVYRAGSESSELYLCNTKTRKSRLITDHFNGTSFAISPDGKSVVYNNYTDDQTPSLFYFANKRSKKISDADLKPAGLSDKGKHIYAYGREASDTVLYHLNTKGKSTQLGLMNRKGIYYFNADHTQILFWNHEGASFVATDGKQACQISHLQVDLLIPDNASSCGRTYPVKNLYGHVYLGLDEQNHTSAWFIHRNAKRSCNLMPQVQNPTLDDSGEFLYFLHDNDLYCLKISHRNNAAVKAKRLAFDVTDYVVTSNRSKVYYLCDDILYSANGRNGMTRKSIATGGIHKELAITGKDVVFYIQNSTAYACSNGRSGQEVIHNAYSLESTNGFVYLMTTETEVYVSTGSKRITKIFTLN